MRNKLKIMLDFFRLYWMILIKREVHLTLNGGLGDVILDSYYIYKIKSKYPQCKIIVYFRDDNSVANPENFSWGSTRKYSVDNGDSINPIREFLNNIPEIDNLIGTDIDNYTYGLRVYPEYFRKYFGYPEPNKINNYLNIILSNGNSNKMENCLKNMAKYDINVALHFRRNSDKVLELAQMIDTNYKNVNFILLGSSEHQVIPEINLKNTISLIDSYSQNKSLLDVLNISTKCDLFIGGRGGFEVFHWLIKTPTICFFDKMGLDELNRGWWDRSLWSHNQIKELYLDSSNIKEIFNHEIKDNLFVK